MSDYGYIIAIIVLSGSWLASIVYSYVKRKSQNQIAPIHSQSSRIWDLVFDNTGILIKFQLSSRSKDIISNEISPTGECYDLSVGEVRALDVNLVDITFVL